MTDSSAQIERDLVRRFATHDDQEAFGAIFRQFARDAYRLALRIAGKPEAAEDIVQDAFVRLWDARRRIDPDRPIRSFILKIVANLCLDRFRRLRRETSLDDNEALLERTPDPKGLNWDGAIDKLAVREAFERLSPIYRATLALRYGEDLSYQEISEALGVTVTAVALRILRGKELLRAHFAAKRSL
jgi:RNA polymerase sigma-70 factor (ECF subfamily)